MGARQSAGRRRRGRGCRNRLDQRADRCSRQSVENGKAQIFTIRPDGKGPDAGHRICASVDPGGLRGPSNLTWAPGGSQDRVQHGVRDSRHRSSRASPLFTIAPDGSEPDRTAARRSAISTATRRTRRTASRSLSIRTWARGRTGWSTASSLPTADGTNAHRLTTSFATHEGFDTESQWSPDGSTIAFTRVKNERKAAIFTIRVDGTGLTQLTPYKLDAASPDWSPDGTTIVFNTYWDSPGGKSADLITIPASGGKRTALTHNRDGKQFSFRPSWSPDGTRIVFTNAVNKRLADGAGVDLYTMHPDGTGAKRLTHMPKRFPRTRTGGWRRDRAPTNHGSTAPGRPPPRSSWPGWSPPSHSGDRPARPPLRR